MRARLTIALLIPVVALVALVAAGGGAAGAKKETPVSGKFSLLIMAHTLASIPQFSVPATNPWNGIPVKAKSSSYRSIPCTGPAPLNNISSDLPTYNARVVGSRPPASMRAHPFQFQLVSIKVGGKGVWELRGRLDFTVCQLKGGATPNPDPVPDLNKPKIFVTFRAPLAIRTKESISFSGTFKIVGGTQRYAGLTGEGTLAGYFFCFDPAGCPAKGAFLDTQMALQGTYSDPTPQLAG